jgi:hypothetical protein
MVIDGCRPHEAHRWRPVSSDEPTIASRAEGQTDLGAMVLNATVEPLLPGESTLSAAMIQWR